MCTGAGCDDAHEGSYLTRNEWCCLLAWLAITYLQLSYTSMGEARALYERVRMWATRGTQVRGAKALVPWANASWFLVMNKAYPWSTNLLVPSAVFGIMWAVLYGIQAVTLWSATKDPSLTLANVDYLYTAALVHLLLNKLWTPVFWMGARMAARYHDAMTQADVFDSAPPSGEWVHMKDSERIKPWGIGWARFSLILSLLIILGNLVSAIIVTEALGRFDRIADMVLWIVYCVWLLYAFFLNLVSVWYYYAQKR